MDLSLCSTEPFSRFHDFHEEFNRGVKVAYGALLTLQEHCKVATGLVSLPIDSEPWGIPWTNTPTFERRTVWQDPSSDIEFSKLFLAEMGIVRTFSALEDMLIAIQAEYDRTAFLRDQPQTIQTEESNCETKLRATCRRLNWELAPIEFALPLYDFFYDVRNCVVHRSGRASKSLEDQSRSDVLLAAISSWPGRDGTRLPDLPEVSANRKISWLP